MCFILDRLIIKARKGNRKAQSKFYDQYSPFVMAVAERYALRKRDAEDVFQESFIKIFKYLHQLKDIASIHSWMKRITINTALDHIRSAPSTNDNIDLRSVELSDQFYEELLDKISNDAILQVISKLPEGYRLVINLYIIDGFSHKEIAEKLAISESTSRSQLVKARKLLKRYLNELGITRYEQVI